MTPRRKLLYVLAPLPFLFAALAIVRALTASPLDPDLIPPKITDWLWTARPADSASMPRRMRVAVVSAEGFEDKARNLRQVEELADRIVASHPDTRLIVFGESALGRYFYPRDPVNYQARIAEPIPGPSSDALAQLAARLRVYLAIGLLESDNARRYNSLLVFGPDGRIVARHRKMLLHSFDERSGTAVAEPNAQVVDVEGFRCGLSICADANSRWLVAQYRAKAIDALIYSVTSHVPPTVRWLKYWPMSRRFGGWVLAANRYGQEDGESYPGTAFVAGPNGAIHALREGPGYVTAIVGKGE